MSKIADDGARRPDPDLEVKERTCSICGRSYRVTQAGLDVHVATCQG